MFAIGKICKLQLEFNLGVKVGLHLCWAVPYILIQWMYFAETKEHIYGFLKFFDWGVLIGFEAALYVVSILSDYFLTFVLEHKKIEEKKEK